MKNLRQCIIATAIVAALPFSVLAQGTINTSMKNSVSSKTSWKNKPTTVGQTLLVEPFILDSLPNAYSFFTNGQQPFQYDPVSNILALIKRGSPNQGVSDGTGGNNIYIRTSPDLGKTWSEPIGPLHDKTSGSGRYPSLLIVNQNESKTNPNDLLYAYSFPLVAGSGFGPVATGFIQGADQITDVNSGVEISGETYIWGTDSKLASTKSGDRVLVVAGISPPEGNTDFTKNSNIALRTTANLSGEFTTSIPPQWSTDKFLVPTAAGSHRQVVGFQRDVNDNLYMAVQARFIDDVDSLLIPAVSKSSDKGGTWSNFERIPKQTIIDFAQANGTAFDSLVFTFSLQSTAGKTIPTSAPDFVVTGVDQFSFINDIFVRNAEGGLDNWIIEIYKANGNWGVRKIADASGSTLSYLDDPNPQPNVDPAVTNQLGNELQISRTADNNKIVAKWVEFRNYITQAGDTIQGSDVAMSVRNVNSNVWSDGIFVTGDVIFDRTTFIPNIIPNDLKNIPILSTRAPFESTDDIATVLEKQRQLLGLQYVVIQTVDPVFTTAINEEFTNGLGLGSVAPNPANGIAQFTYTLPTEGQIYIEVVNIIGQKVLTLDNGFKSAGEHRVTFNASELPNGTYYYTLKHNGGSITRMLTIVR